MGTNMSNFPKKTLEDFLAEERTLQENSLKDIQPYFDEKELIVISSSDYYVKYASVTLLSIMENASPKYHYEIAVLTNDMSLYNQTILHQIVARYPQFKLRIFNITEKIQNIKFYTWAHFTINTYFRLLIPELFKQYNKVLYLDSDLVINADLKELLKITLQKYCLAAVRDTHVISYCNGLNLEQLDYNKTVLQLKNPLDYYQMGVCLYNIPQILKDFASDHLIRIAGQVKYKWLDQDILNTTFHGHIKELPLKWNVMVANKHPFCDEYYLPGKMRREYALARLNPCIIHYCGGICFQHAFMPDMGHYFFKYARLSPYYEEILFTKQQAMLDLKQFYRYTHKIVALVYRLNQNRWNYWRAKLLSNLTWGKTKQHYLDEKNHFKDLVHLAQNIQRY